MLKPIVLLSSLEGSAAVQDDVRGALECMLRLQACDLPTAEDSTASETKRRKTDAASQAAACNRAAGNISAPSNEDATDEVAAKYANDMQRWNEAVPAALQHAGLQQAIADLDDTGASCHTLATACNMMCSRLIGGACQWHCQTCNKALHSGANKGCSVGAIRHCSDAVS
jgi:hypothetical protein